jgi:chromosome partitioning protein
MPAPVAMQIITFANNKGGVGKTTSALAVAYCFAAMGHRTLLIDADPQGNSTVSIPTSGKSGGSLAQALKEDYLAPHIQAVGPNLLYVPAGEDLSTQERVFGTKDDHSWFFLSQLADLAKGEGTKEFMDIEFVVIDTGPNLGPLTVTALTASSHVFIPMLPNLYSSEGMSKLIEKVERIQRMLVRLNLKPVEIGGIFFTRYARTYRRRHHNNYVKDLETDPALTHLIMKQTIRENVSLDEAPDSKMSVFEWAPDSTGAQDYRGLTEEILTRLKPANHE